MCAATLAGVGVGVGLTLAHNDEVAQRDEAKQKSGEVSVSFNKSEPCTGEADASAMVAVINQAIKDKALFM